MRQCRAGVSGSLSVGIINATREDLNDLYCQKKGTSYPDVCPGLTVREMVGLV